MLKKVLCIIMVLALSIGVFAGCGKDASDTKVDAVESSTEPESVSDDTATEEEKDAVEILVAAAASLEYSYVDELIPMFEQQYPWITVSGTYDSSGKLQTQIEEGLDADVFMSAATKQMIALKEQGMIMEDSIVDLLENEIVLITPTQSDLGITSFEDIIKASAIALGDPESVPVGQYSQEALTSLGLWDEVSAKTSFGTNVTEVLKWVAEASADAGIVYATDVATTDEVVVVAKAPEGSLASKVIYPVAVVSASEKQEAAQLFVDFLSSPEAIAVFEKYGFTANI